MERGGRGLGGSDQPKSAESAFYSDISLRAGRFVALVVVESATRAAAFFGSITPE
jgi:hypothetical protein